MIWLDSITAARALLQLSHDVQHIAQVIEGRGNDKQDEPSKSSSVSDSKPRAREESMDVDPAGSFGFCQLRNYFIIMFIGAIQVLRNADGVGVSNFQGKSITKV